MVQELVFESVDTMSQAEFAEWVAPREGLEGRCELLNGRVVMTPPAGYPHGIVESAIVTILTSHARREKLGRVFGSSQGFDLPSGDTVEPDVSFVSRERWQSVPPAVRGRFLRVVPDFVVEILSAGTRSRDRGEKRAIYERNGVREYWLVDPDARTVTVFLLENERFDRGLTVDADASLSATAVAGLTLKVAELFEDE
jgi:Uma2 family endonuclease